MNIHCGALGRWGAGALGRWGAGALGRWGAGALALLFLGISLCGCDNSVAAPGSQSIPAQFDLIPDGFLRPSSKRIDLGTVRQRGQRRQTFALSNPTGYPVEVANLHTSCPCLEIELEPRVVKPSQTVIAVLKLDLNEEPDFVGYLAMEAEGRTADGDLAFAVELHVRATATE